MISFHINASVYNRSHPYVPDSSAHKYNYVFEPSQKAVATPTVCPTLIRTQAQVLILIIIRDEGITLYATETGKQITQPPTTSLLTSRSSSD